MPNVFTVNLLANQNFCITATSNSAGALLQLNLRNGVSGSPLQQFGYDGQYIYLTQNPKLVIDIKGVTPGNNVQLILNTKDPSRSTQGWNMGASALPNILNTGAAGYCIDNYQGAQQAGNPVVLWQASPSSQNNANQQWTPAAIPDFLR